MLLVFATRNQGKLVELRQLLQLPDIEIIDVAEASKRIGRAIPDTDEDRDTFVGNATKKAQEVSELTKWPALADDSGLEVDALGGRPGVHSARYHQIGPEGQISRAIQHAAILKPELRTAANNRKLLAELAGVTHRAARFRCVLALADVHGKLGTEVITADGTCEGTILDAPRGSGGFGYDPLFLVAGTESTMAELDHDAKNAVSHRGKAMQAMEPRLRAYFVT